MPKPKTATAILEARGAFKRHPERKRPLEPKVDSSFPSNPPQRFSAAEKKSWRQIVKIAPAGVLTGADVITVEIVAILLAEFRDGPKEMPTTRLSRLTAEMNKLGLSPSARAGLEIKRPEENEFDDV